MVSGSQCELFQLSGALTELSADRSLEKARQAKLRTFVGTVLNFLLTSTYTIMHL
jgi:hypothetical protein